MNSQKMVLQDAAAGRVSNVLRGICEVASLTTFARTRVSVAYASQKGCENLHSNLAKSAKSWIGAEKRWLVSIDFGQTSPDALTFLADLPNSRVRIADGLALLKKGLIPTRAFHPKTYLFIGKEKAAAADLAIVSGSANLTYGALNTNAEHVFISRRWGNPVETDKQLLSALGVFLAWWDVAWASATPYSKGFIEKYKTLYSPKKQLQDSEELSKSFADSKDAVIEVDEGAKWAASKCFWIEAGKLYKNRGPKQAGNQLDCRRGTRVFFGFPPDSVPTNTVLGQVRITYQGKQPQQRSVKFGDNAMDKVNLPIPGEYGPERYDDSVLHFERTGDQEFQLTMRPLSGAKGWVNKSKKQGLKYSFAGGRQFGFYT